MPKKRVAIIHPWMPRYRTDFFSELERLLGSDQIELDVFYGQTPPEWAERNDSDASSIGTKLNTRFFNVGSRNLILKDVNAVVTRAPYDALIFEQAIRNIETYRLLLHRGVARKHAYWGHGRTYTGGRSKFEEQIKLSLTKRSSWFFGYTEGGVKHLVEHGFPAAHTTVVRNSTNTRAFAEQLQEVTPEDLADFRRKYDLCGKTALYIGGLDAAKRLDFLVAAADIAYSRCPLFRLLIVGAGSQSGWLEEQARSRPWMRLLGSSAGALKCLAFQSAQVLAIPGRVGLVAVDSLTACVPIVTTKWPYHAPEFEYLEPGRTCEAADDTIIDYSSTLLSTMGDSNVLTSLARECAREAPKYSIETMASNFAEGVHSLLRTV